NRRTSKANVNPSTFPGTARDRLTQPQLAVAVSEGRIGGGSRKAAGDGVVNRQEELLERVGKTLGMSAGIRSQRRARRRQQGGVACQKLVGSVAAADPEVVGAIAVPGQGPFGPGNFQDDPVLPSGDHLRDMKHPAGLFVPAEQDGAVVLGGN